MTKPDLHLKRASRNLLSAARQLGIWRRGNSFPYNAARVVFRGVEFGDRSYLEIGCGDGLYCVWAELNGANSVLGLEPEAEGSTCGATRTYERLKQHLRLSKGRIVGATLQSFDSNGSKYDIVALLNTVNHLDERACMNLPVEVEANRMYIELFRKIRSLVKDQGWLVLTDCARRNFFGDLGVRNPFWPSIEWHKHQQPAVWIKLLKEAGFGHEHLVWTGEPRLCGLGAPLRNRLYAYFTRSHFRLSMRPI